MQVQELIDYLTKYYKPDESIVVSWWDQSHFDDAERITTAEWAACCDAMDDIDWSRTHDALTDALHECLENMED
jgi:hypothetical protein